MMKLTKGQAKMVEVGAGAGFVVGLVTLGIGLGMSAKYLLERLRGRAPALMAGETLFTGEDNIVKAAKGL